MGSSRGVWGLRPQLEVPPLHPVLSLVTIAISLYRHTQHLAHNSNGLMIPFSTGFLGLEVAASAFLKHHLTTAVFTTIRYRGCGGNAPTQGFHPCTLYPDSTKSAVNMADDI